MGEKMQSTIVRARALPGMLSLCVIVGFALFKAAQSIAYATALSSGGTPFIMLSDLEFTIVTSFPIMVADLVVVVVAFKGLLPSFHLPVVIPSVALAASALLSFFGVLNGLPPMVHLAVVCGVYGVGTALITLAWTETFASLEVDVSMKLLASAMLLSALLSILCTQLPNVALMGCIAAFVVAGSVLYYLARNVVRGTELPVFGSLPAKSYVRGFVSISNGLVVLLALGCVVGVLNSFMLVDGYLFEGSEIAGNVGVLLGYIAFFVVAYAMPKHYGIESVYRFLFPVLATLLLVWPFMGSQFGYVFSCLLIAGYQFSSVGVLFLIIKESHERTLNPYVFMGVSVLLIRLSVLVGLLVGSEVASRSYDWISKAILVVAIAMYALAFVLLFMSRTRKKGQLERVSARKPIPLQDDEWFAQKTASIGKRYQLTQREEEILTHLSRGRSSTYIGEALWLSPNTVRGHIKKIYVKLGVHSKQELIDLFLDDVSGSEVE